VAAWWWWTSGITDYAGWRRPTSGDPTGASTVFVSNGMVISLRWWATSASCFPFYAPLSRFLADGCLVNLWRLGEEVVSACWSAFRSSLGTMLGVGWGNPGVMVIF
jgi:hypothetical protein